MLTRPRHIIWITTDHTRYDCIGAHGNPAMHTPNLDALVNNGVTFSQCYANNPLCMPSRCSFMIRPRRLKF
jgi:arylsulfatase A-like enzyme